MTKWPALKKIKKKLNHEHVGGTSNYIAHFADRRFKCTGTYVCTLCNYSIIMEVTTVNYSSEIRGLCVMKWPSQKVNICHSFLIWKPTKLNSISLSISCMKEVNKWVENI